ncbi:MAG: nucleoside triphosphate pyrophosphohydrolase [Alphaproteobacteria bacterium]
MEQKEHYTISDLMKLARELRTPGTGCPWDLKQTFKTIIPHTLEEAYEVADAIDRNAMDDLREELGDLLFQVVLYAQIAKEAGYFDLNDIIHNLTQKMISRHPHVFADQSAANASEVNAIWDAQKDKESKNKPGTSALDGITLALPALLKAQKLQKKAASAGFEWNSPLDVLDKLEEEIAEMRAAIANNDKENQEEELGDIIFLLVNYGRMLDIRAEEAVRKCNLKFENRFRGLEKEIRKQGSTINEVSQSQKIQAWNNQKLKERKTA